MKTVNALRRLTEVQYEEGTTAHDPTTMVSAIRELAVLIEVEHMRCDSEFVDERLADWEKRYVT
jgi:hypothetical protein